LLVSIFKSSFIFLILLVNAQHASGVTLPSRLSSFSRSGENLDPGLEAWAKKNIDVVAVSDMNPAQVLLWIADKDAVVRALIILDSHQNKKQIFNGDLTEEQVKLAEKAETDLAELHKKTLKSLPEILSSELQKKAEDRSVMLADLFLAWKAAEPSQAIASGFEPKIFSEAPIQSCAVKGLAISKTNREKVQSLNTDGLLEAINLAGKYQSPTHRRKYLEVIAAAIPESRRKEVLGPLREYARDLPLLARKFAWLQDDDTDESYVGKSFIDVLRATRKKKCADAEKALEKHLSKKVSQETITLAVEAGTEVERCFRNEKKTAANDFWQRIAPKFEERYGKEGALWAKVRVGYLKWISNDLAEAIKDYEAILAEAQPAEKFKALTAKSLYILGKIADDKGEPDEASKYYAEYLEKYSDQEDFEFSLNSLIVNLAVKKQWSKMIVPLDHFLMQQSLVHIDKRPVGAMAFSLFWIGRAHLQLGNKELAREMWRRLAAEYYSTFYGAMGHYLLEQSSGRSYAIEPSRVSGFNFNVYQSALPQASKAAANRTLAYLAAGMPERARCEVEEVVAASQTDYDAVLARTLLLHGSGAWLDAIKIYDAIPRSVRNGLPVGFERVLFPRKYADVVKSKASKLNLDPDFVFALMRQESVFSKDAMSPVGAVGLMQLMPSTAKLELGKLSVPYVDKKEREELKTVMMQEESLRDPSVNVTLGVHHLWRLMKMYKSPVFALTAYNASPAATQKWQKSISSEDWLTFIERIPYKETRAYVKLILRNYFYYKRWYNSPDGKSQEHIDSIVEELVSMSKQQTTKN
jgi:soluble lytic murein transglycosylase-like protein